MPELKLLNIISLMFSLKDLILTLELRDGFSNSCNHSFQIVLKEYQVYDQVFQRHLQ